MSSNYGFEPTLDGLNNIDADSSTTNNIICDTLQVNLNAIAPTMITGNNSNNIATTAFVQNAIIGAGSGYVDLTTNQTVNGIKTFTSVPLCSTAPTTGNMLTNKTYVDSVATGASLSANNTFTGTNAFRKPIYTQTNGGTTGMTLTTTNQNITIVAGAGNTQTGGSFLNAYNLNVPIGNNENQVTVSIPFDVDIFGGPLVYPTGITVTLTITGVSASILKNGVTYSGSSPTAIYYNTASLPTGSPSGYIKQWTGVGGVKSPDLKAYVGNISFPVALDIANTSTDTYQMSIKVDGTLTYSSVSPYTWVWNFATTSWSGFTSTNASNAGGTFTYNNPTSLIPNSIISGDNGSYIEANGNLFITSSSYSVAPSGINFTPSNQENYIKWTPTNSFSQTFDLFKIGTNANGDVGVLQIMAENQDFDINNASGTTIATFSSTTSGGTINVPATTGFSLIPPGTILTGLYTSVPGYLLCNGASILIANATQLFAVIGYSYGGGGASFNLPDFQGMFLRMNGSQTIGGVTYTGGSISLSGRQQDAVLNPLYCSNQGFYNVDPGGGGTTRQLIPRSRITTDPVDTNTGILPRFDRTAIENRPVNYTVNYFIKY